MTSIKLSILWLYHHIFAARSSGSGFNKPVILAAAVICITWFLITTMILIFQCTPISAYWDTLDGWLLVDGASCMSSPRLLLGYELTNFFLDVFVLCIPLPIIWKLNLQQSKKIALVVIFLLGAL